MLHMNFGGKLGGNKSAESIIRYLESMAKLSGFLSEGGQVTTKVQDYFDLNWGLSAAANTVNILKHEQFDEAISFDGNE